jgi:hypothetical protein
MNKLNGYFTYDKIIFNFNYNPLDYFYIFDDNFKIIDIINISIFNVVDSYDKNIYRIVNNVYCINSDIKKLELEKLFENCANDKIPNYLFINNLNGNRVFFINSKLYINNGKIINTSELFVSSYDERIIKFEDIEFKLKFNQTQAKTEYYKKLEPIANSFNITIDTLNNIIKLLKTDNNIKLKFNELFRLDKLTNIINDGDN